MNVDPWPDLSVQITQSAAGAACPIRCYACRRTGAALRSKALASPRRGLAGTGVSQHSR